MAGKYGKRRIMKKGRGSYCKKWRKERGGDVEKIMGRVIKGSERREIRLPRVSGGG